MLYEDVFVDWKPYRHPVYGEIEAGGFKRYYTRLHLGFLLENDAYRNIAFTLYQVPQTPEIVIENVEEKKPPGGLKQVTVTISNKRLIPTHSAHDLNLHIERPDYAILAGPEVIAGVNVVDKDFNVTEEQPDSPVKIEIPNIPGMGSVTVRWIVKGSADLHTIVDSAKGGKTEQ